VDIRELTGSMKPALCPSLTGKPKVFFIQACQGKETGSHELTDRLRNQQIHKKTCKPTDKKAD
jgi:hypothetical protein